MGILREQWFGVRRLEGTGQNHSGHLLHGLTQNWDENVASPILHRLKRPWTVLHYSLVFKNIELSQQWLLKNAETPPKVMDLWKANNCRRNYKVRRSPLGNHPNDDVGNDRYWKLTLVGPSLRNERPQTWSPSASPLPDTEQSKRKTQNKIRQTSLPRGPLWRLLPWWPGKSTASLWALSKTPMPQTPERRCRNGYKYPEEDAEAARNGRVSLSGPTRHGLPPVQGASGTGGKAEDLQSRRCRGQDRRSSAECRHRTPWRAQSSFAE